MDSGWCGLQVVPVWDGASITGKTRVDGVLVLAFRVALNVPMWY